MAICSLPSPMVDKDEVTCTCVNRGLGRHLLENDTAPTVVRWNVHEKNAPPPPPFRIRDCECRNSSKVNPTSHAVFCADGSWEFPAILPFDDRRQKETVCEEQAMVSSPIRRVELGFGVLCQHWLPLPP
ncbi:hypothetical protein OPV22_026809 [Ensete ventricosum]|uniref:Uncharacterized protein n=1 Tax=Ensete ventricosum TaxID=4639 RepID=A0AAV8PTZ4_ENSVE|nr:hypothetical protein OPV22_026809 [Ensete ventricosum]